MIDHVDFSQWKAWQFCSWSWYEKYVLKRRKRWPEGLRSDALAVGSLTHSGLENWYAHQSPEISEESIAKINPTPECLRLCRQLVHGYVSTFPEEQWQLVRCEQPLRFPLVQEKEGLAKLDLYFYLHEPTQVESGLAGYEITLNPGWWIQEYKTKSAYVEMGEWMRSWVTNMQADFQMLALQAQIRKGYVENVDIPNRMLTQVNGLLVNVIEKPRDYVPKRTCKQCKKAYPFSASSPNSPLFAK